VFQVIVTIDPWAHSGLRERPQVDEEGEPVFKVLHNLENHCFGAIAKRDRRESTWKTPELKHASHMEFESLTLFLSGV
jgi:hypothetical protein